MVLVWEDLFAEDGSERSLSTRDVMSRDGGNATDCVLSMTAEAPMEAAILEMASNACDLPSDLATASVLSRASSRAASSLSGMTPPLSFSLLMAAFCFSASEDTAGVDDTAFW